MRMNISGRSSLGLSAVFILSLCLLSSCGSGSDSDAPSTDACEVLGLPVQKIVNGTPCGGLETTPIVRVLLKVQDGNSYDFIPACTGTAVSQRTIVTAAHCFELPSGYGQIVGAGIAVGPSDNIRVIAGSYAIHPEYGYQNNTAFNDVAVITLDSDAGVNTLPILASETPESGDIVSIFGYGQRTVSADGTSDFADLVSGQMSVSDVTVNHIFTVYGDEGSNVCFGDSGGPLVLERNGKTGTTGVVSQGTASDCGEGDTTSYTNLSKDSVLSWIRTVAPDAEVL